LKRLCVSCIHKTAKEGNSHQSHGCNGCFDYETTTAKKAATEDLDDKLDVKADGDVGVEMKNDEDSPPNDGPITQSVPNLGDESKISVGKRSEPAFEVQPNLPRVTPTQLVMIDINL